MGQQPGTKSASGLADKLVANCSSDMPCKTMIYSDK